MKILVTGATGFLGRHLCRALQAAGHQVVAVHTGNADLRDSRSLDRFNDGRYDQIYHLAAWTQAGDFCLHHPGEQWMINQLINTHVLTWWQDRQPQAKLIAMGSSCCYEPGLDLVEENYLRGEPIESLYTYALTKRMLYVGLRMLHLQFGLNYLCLVPSTLYGVDYPLDGRQMHFIFDLIRKIVESRRAGTPVVLWGDGHQAREVIHVNDFVRAALRLAASVNNELVNVGSGEEHTIRHFAGEIGKLTGFDPRRIQYDASKYVGARSKVLNVAKLRRLLPDFKPTPLATGLQEVVAWFEQATS